MSNRVCPDCGLEYSDTYKKCPFCEEEKAIRAGKPIRRGGKRLSKKNRSRGAGGVLLTVVAVVIICTVAVVLAGPKLLESIGIRVEQEDVLPPVDEKLPSSEDGDTETSHSGDTVTPPMDDSSESVDVPVVDPDIPPAPLALDHSAISIPAGEKAKLTATGGNGSVVWSSSNENIATVDGGTVSGLAGGTVTVTALSGEETVTCAVTVTGDPWVSPVALSLNRTDFTMGSKDPPWQMKIKGTDNAAIWRSANPSVVTVSDTGLVTRVGKGTTTITAEVDGHTLVCTVRCP